MKTSRESLKNAGFQNFRICFKFELEGGEDEFFACIIIVRHQLGFQLLTSKKSRFSNFEKSCEEALFK